MVIISQEWDKEKNESLMGFEPMTFLLHTGQMLQLLGYKRRGEPGHLHVQGSCRTHVIYGPTNGLARHSLS